MLLGRIPTGFVSEDLIQHENTAYMVLKAFACWVTNGVARCCTILAQYGHYTRRQRWAEGSFRAFVSSGS